MDLYITEKHNLIHQSSPGFFFIQTGHAGVDLWRHNHKINTLNILLVFWSDNHLCFTDALHYNRIVMFLSVQQCV